MSSAQFNAGQTHGKTQEKTEHYVDSAKEKASHAAGQAQEKASQAAAQTSGFLQQTGEQMKSMAQGAIDGVKNTLGVGEKNK